MVLDPIKDIFDIATIVNYLKDMTILTQKVADRMVAKQGTDIVIPDRYTSIGDEAFYDKRLTSVDIPDSVTSIGEYAFYNNRLKSIDIPDSVTSTDWYAFEKIY